MVLFNNYSNIDLEQRFYLNFFFRLYLRKFSSNQVQDYG